MKAMSCKQLGGPCELPLLGNAADEVVRALDGNFAGLVSRRDEAHERAVKGVKER